MEDLKDLDIIIFSASKGKDKSVPIPLLVEPTIYTERDKYYLFSFVGSILGRSKIREKLLKLYNKNHIITECVSYEVFIEVMESSIFSLCPRGKGQNSYRICEALQHNSIPVYISDEFWLMEDFDFNDIGILIKEDEISDLEHILNSKSIEEINRLIQNGQHILNKYYNYEGLKNYIIDKL